MWYYRNFWQKQPSANEVINGLKMLEYRGYDSAGIALYDGQNLQRMRAKGKIKFLQEQWNKKPY